MNYQICFSKLFNSKSSFKIIESEEFLVSKKAGLNQSIKIAVNA